MKKKEVIHFFTFRQGHLRLAVFVCTLALCACGDTSTDGRQGNYPAAAQATGAEEIADQLFTDSRIPCADDRAIANGLWEITRSQMDLSSDPRLLDWGVDEVALKDGPGRIAAVVYSFKPGDPGVISTATDYYLLNKGCRVLHWKYVGP